MICPRCKSKSYVPMYRSEIKCIACGHTDYQVPDEILKEFDENIGKMGQSTQHYIRNNSKKYYN